LQTAPRYDGQAAISDELSFRKACSMQIYMFTSQASPTLHAFAGDPDGSKLPESHGPWGSAGSIRSDQHPPHRFSRARIEEAIKLIGFQLWRVKPSPVKKRAKSS
jgi:hypothetical protein